MWRVKTFKTAEAKYAWIAAREHRIQWVTIFINCPTKRHNRYAIEWKPLRMINFD